MAGVTVAGQLLNKLEDSSGQIAIIEPGDKNFYRPGWTMVGGIGYDPEETAKPMGHVIPEGATWVKEWCESFEPEGDAIILGSGQRVEYDVLIVAAGISYDFDRIRGARETLGKNGVSSIYGYQDAPEVWKNITELKSGTAIFTNPSTPVSCGGAPQKIMFLAEDHWQKNGVGENIDISYWSAGPKVFGVQRYAETLTREQDERNIQRFMEHDLVEVDGLAKLATFEHKGQRVTKAFDFLHIVPPMSAPAFIKRSPLANAETGWVDVDKKTCQHTKYPNVFSLGDCSAVPARTFTGLASQAPVVVHNVAAFLRDGLEAANAQYDGYTCCPVMVGDNKVMLAEFNVQTGEPVSTFWPIDQSKPNPLFYFMKRFIFSPVYFNLCPVGRWFSASSFFVFEPNYEGKTVKRGARMAPQAMPGRGSAGRTAFVGASAEVGRGYGSRTRAKVASKATPDQAAEEMRELDVRSLGVEVPNIPGDIGIAGDLSSEVVAALAPRYKGWLYLNSAENPAFHPQVLEQSGCAVEVQPLSLSPLPTSEDAAALLEKMERLPRPLMVQCTSGNRAGAALLLWLAKQKGYNATSAEQLATELDLKFFTSCEVCGPVRDWVIAQLPPPTGSAPPAALRGGPLLEQRFVDDGTSTLTYLLACPKTGEALLIDPVLGQEDRDLAWAEERGLTLKYVVNTHAHADHITSGAAIRKKRPAVRTVIARTSKAKADLLVSDGDLVDFGGYALEVVETPGHTAGCVSFILQVGGEPKAVFTGDALLIRGCGRTDFQGGSAEALYDSITQRIFTLPGETLIYPGHDYKGRNVSTVEEERTSNPRLTKGKEEFVKLMANLNLPMPKLIQSAVPANMRDGEEK